MVLSQRRAFSLVELLVVLTILAILFSLLLPAIQVARESARTTACANNLHNLGIAYNNYKSARGERATHGMPDKWTQALLPYMENQNAMLGCPNDPKAAHLHGIVGVGGGGGGGGQAAFGGGIVGNGIGAFGAPGGAGNVQYMDKLPKNLRQDKFEDSRWVYVFREQANIELTEDIPTQLSQAGTVGRGLGAKTPSVIPAGKKVDVYLVHFDPPGNRGGTTYASMNFYGKILGIVNGRKQLDDTDLLFQVPGTKYATGEFSRGFEFLDNENKGEVATISSDMRTFTFDVIDTTGYLEELRIITEPGGMHTSYAMNSYIYSAEIGRAGQILMLDYYGKGTVDIQGDTNLPYFYDLVDDPSSTPCRHMGMINVLFYDGHVALMHPDELFSAQDCYLWYGEKTPEDHDETQ